MAQQGSRRHRRTSPHQTDTRATLASEVVHLTPSLLSPYPDNPRQHSDAQINAIMRNMRGVWTNPILIDENRTILSGHGRHEAAKRLRIAKVPTLTLSGLSEARKRAIVISENRLAETSTWDPALLRKNLGQLIDIDFDVELTGFSTGEIDILIDGPAAPAATEPVDVLDASLFRKRAVSQLGDIWDLGPHKLLCGDALQMSSYEQLLGQQRAQMVIADPPYNVRISNHARGRGKIRHREFAMASGEISDTEFQEFLETAMRCAIACSVDSAIHDWFMDWRHLPAILSASLPQYSAWKQLLVWNKTNAGQGTFYRSKHELILVFKTGEAPHINNFGLGSSGRYRANVLDFPGGSSLDPRRRHEMDIHPTVKPVALIAELIRDCTHRQGIVLDGFAGSGTLFLAAERTGRIARAIEIDPIYVDVAIQRWEQESGLKAKHAATGLSLDELRTKRGRAQDEAITSIAAISRKRRSR